jgi:hypothetical protein
MSNDSNHKQPFTKEDSYKNLDRVNYWITNCDTKTSFVLAFVGVFIAVFLTSNTVNESFANVIGSLATLKFADVKTIIIFLIVVATGAFVYYIVRGIMLLLYALTATVDISMFDAPSLVKESNLLFAAISGKSFDDFKRELNQMSEQTLANDIDSQTYINSVICAKKFSNYNKGVGNIKRGVIFFVVMTILLFIFHIISSTF